jgi:hypothetical protein
MSPRPVRTALDVLDAHGPKMARAALVLVMVSIWTWTTYRAAVASFTHDEAYTWLHFVPLSWSEIFAHKEAFTNNHLLNTLGMKASATVFGNGELALRLPNLLALALFMMASARLLAPLSAGYALGGAILLFFNCWLLELFSLARGYGLSIGFMFLALHQLVQLARRPHARGVVFYHAASVLATLSNFTLLNVHLAGIAALGLVYMMQGRAAGPKKVAWRNIVRWNLAGVAASVAVLWIPIRNTLRQNALDFGSKDDFFHATVHTWWKSLFAGMQLPVSVWNALFAATALITLLSAIHLFRRWKRRDPDLLDKDVAMPILLAVFLLACIAAEVQHLLFGVDRLVGRFAMFLEPLFVLVTVQALAAWWASGRKRAPSLTLALAAVCCMVACVRHFGPYRSMEWQYDVHSKNAMAAIALDLRHSGSRKEVAHVGIHWLFEPSLNYYRLRMGLAEIDPLDRDGIKPGDAYRLLFEEEANTRASDGYQRLCAWPESSTVLWKRMP